MDERLRRKARMRLVALIEVLDLEGGWTHEVHQTFRFCYGMRGRAAVLDWYGRLLDHVAVAYAPDAAFMVAERHRKHPEYWHLHGLWRVPARRLWRRWWWYAKEYWGGHVGWARFRPLPYGHRVALARAVGYATKHAVKCHPVAPSQYMRWYHRWEEGDGTIDGRVYHGGASYSGFRPDRR